MPAVAALCHANLNCSSKVWLRSLAKMGLGGKLGSSNLLRLDSLNMRLVRATARFGEVR
jgi:hypothetical protein